LYYGTVVNTCVFVAHPNAVWNGLTSHYDYFHHLERGLALLGEGGADYLMQSRFKGLEINAGFDL
jgi:hypothetical protein